VSLSGQSLTTAQARKNTRGDKALAKRFASENTSWKRTPIRSTIVAIAIVIVIAIFLTLRDLSVAV